MKLVRRFLLLLVVVNFMIISLIGCATVGPGIPKGKIPSDISVDVRAQIEKLYSKDLIERKQGAYNLGEMGARAVPAVPFLIGIVSNGKRNEPNTFIIENADFVIKDANEDTGEAFKALLKIGKPAVESLIVILNDDNKDTPTRQVAARILGEIGDPRAIEPLIAILSHLNISIGDNSVELALKKIGTPAVGSLISALNDKNEYVVQDSARILGIIGDSRAVEPLINVLKDKKYGCGESHTRKETAEALEKIKDHRSVEFLITAWKNMDLEIIAGAHCFYISQGEVGTEDILIKALEAYGDIAIAENFLNCGNYKLQLAASDWVPNHGYTVKYSSYGGSGPKWGIKNR